MIIDKTDYEYVILSLIPETNLRIPKFYAQAWVQKQSQDFDNHHSSLRLKLSTKLHPESESESEIC